MVAGRLLLGNGSQVLVIVVAIVLSGCLVRFFDLYVGDLAIRVVLVVGFAPIMIVLACELPGWIVVVVSVDIRCMAVQAGYFG